MGFTDVIGKIGNLFDPVGGITEGVKEIVSTFKLPPGQQRQFELKMKELELNAKIQAENAKVRLQEAFVEDQEALREQAKEEIKSKDMYVARARISWQWGILAIYVLNYGVLASFTAVYSAATKGVDNMVIRFAELPYELHALALFLVGGYSVLKTYEKKHKVRGN